MGFTPEKMLKIKILVHKNYLKKVVDLLYNYKALHIKEYKPDNRDVMDIGKPMAGSEKISELLVLTNSLLNLLESNGLKYDGKEYNYTLKSIEAELHNIEKEVKKLVDEKKLINNKREELKRIFNLLVFLKELDIKDISLIHDYATLDYRAGYIEGDVSDKLKILEKKENVHVITSEKDGETRFIIFFEKGKHKEIEKIIKNLNYRPVDLTLIKVIDYRKSGLNDIKLIDREKSLLKHFFDTITKTTNVYELLNLINKEFDNIKKEEKRISGELERIKKEKVMLLLYFRSKLSKEKEKYFSALNFGETNYIVQIEGWIPVNKKERIINDIKKITNNTAYIKTELETKEAPVMLKHNALTKPFVSLLELYSLPSYKEIDPTNFMMFTFPIIFGMILGDIGYGLVLLLFFMGLKKKFPEAKNLLNVLIMASISTIIFGFLFGEVFGLEEIFGHKLFSVLHRAHDINTLLLWSVYVGLIHINLGLILGFINEFRNHGFIAALFEKVSWMLLEIGGILLITNHMGYTHVYNGLLYALIGIAILWIALGEGIKGIVELPSILSNILSYTRIGAVGVASVILASLINEFSSYLMNKSIYFLPLVVLVLIVGHGVNIMLGTLEPFIHTLRLHFVEHFTKYYKGGGKEYKPFGSE